MTAGSDRDLLQRAQRQAIRDELSIYENGSMDLAQVPFLTFTCTQNHQSTETPKHTSGACVDVNKEVIRIVKGNRK